MSQRLYAQLQPDAAGLNHLLDVQRHAPPRGRFVKPSRLHLTLIHFGVIEDVITGLPCEPTIALDAIGEYITDTKTILETYPERSFYLQPTGFDLFGDAAHTLVITYQPTPQLVELHARLLTMLKRFVKNCGIKEVEDYMRSDPNFKHALSIRPHITIAKAYEGRLPFDNTLLSIKLTIMPFEYDQP